MVDDEAKLLRSAKQGDDQAFARLVEPSLDRAYHLALRTLNHRSEAEDALQDALYKAWRALPRFRSDAKFSTWLYRIVWRTCVDRTQRREPLPLETDLADPSLMHDPEKRWIDVERQSEVERALNRLPLSYRTVLVLFYIEDLPIREIAEITEAPLGTVKTRLHRGRLELRRMLMDMETPSQKGEG